MLKSEARFHYGIMKHIKGQFHADDCLVLGENYLPLSYIYKASADYMCDQLNKAHSGRCSFKVVRLD